MISSLEYLDGILFAVGLIAAMAIYMPYSPMTIDMLMLPRGLQIGIYRYRFALWAVVDVCFAVVLLRGLSGAGWLGQGTLDSTIAGIVGSAGAGWLWVMLITIGMLLFMFWSGYVPYVMSPPKSKEIMSVDQADGVLQPDDAVLGISNGSEARAYLRDHIARPHLLNDNVGGQPLTISYCILCNSGTAFKSELDGRALNLECVTAFNNNIIYKESGVGNYIQQLDGKVFRGPDKGKELTRLPIIQSTWAEWKRLYPNTTFFSAPPLTLRDKMVAVMLQMMIPMNKLSKRRKPFHRVRGKLDDRLSAMSIVLGIELNGDSIGYPLEALKERPVFDDTLGGQPITVFYDPATDVAEVYTRTHESQSLNFTDQTDGDGFAAKDNETGSTWNISGKATTGKLAGQELAKIPHYNKIFWFSWALFKPNTRLGLTS